MKDRPRINTLDLTLDQLDEVAALVADGRSGRTAAIVHVGLRERDPDRFGDLDACRTLTLQDVDIVEEEDDHPTSGLS